MRKILCFILITLSFVLLSSCSQAIYTVTFETLQGEEVESIQVKHGSKIPNPPMTYLEGHTFNGWNYNGKRWNFQRGRVTSNMTLYAVWSPNLYEISFDVDGGSYIEPITNEYGSRVTLPKSTKEGYSFYAWEYNGKFINSFDVPSKEVTLKAVWDIDYIVWDVWRNNLVKYKKDYEKVYVPSYYLIDYNKVYIDTISNGCFSQNVSLKEVIIQEGIKAIDNSAFLSASKLEKVTLPSTLESIGSYAFYMTNIKEIVIPKSVTKIAGYAFYNQNSPMVIYLEHNEIPEGWGSSWYLGDATIYLQDEWTYNEQGQPILK